LSGFDLARHEHTLLWLIPLLMLAVLIFGLLRRRPASSRALAIVSAIAGGATAWLMNDERARVNDAATLISARLTGWFWLGLLGSLLMILSAIGIFLKPPRAPAE